MSHQLQGRLLRVVDGLAHGWSTEKIADKLGVAPATIRTDVSKICTMFQIPPYEIRNYILEILYGVADSVGDLAEIDFAADSTDLPGYDVAYYIEEELLRDKGA